MMVEEKRPTGSYALMQRFPKRSGRGGGRIVGVASAAVGNRREKCLSAGGSGADPTNAPRVDRGEGGEDRRHERPQILHAVGSGAREHNAKRQCRDALLKLDDAVHRDKNIILAARSAERLAVPDPTPAATGNGVYGMTMEFRSKAYWVTARQAAGASAARVSHARSSNETACSRRTDGNWRRNSSRVSPPSR